MKSQKITIILLAVLALILSLGLIISQSFSSSKKAGKEALVERGFYQFSKPRDLAPVPLKNLEGDNVTLTDRHKQWQLVNFGYMFCPDICPINLRFMSDIKGVWDQANKALPLAITHITFDPERDTPDKLQPYLEYHNSHYDGLTGELENIRKVAQQLNVIFIHEKPDQYGNYFISHSDSIALLNPQGQYIGMFKGPYNDRNVDEIVKTLGMVIK